MLSFFLVIFFVFGVFLPFLDNFAHFGGLTFGFFLSWIVLPMKPVDECDSENESCNNHHKIMLPDKYKERLSELLH